MRFIFNKSDHTAAILISVSLAGARNDSPQDGPSDRVSASKDEEADAARIFLSTLPLDVSAEIFLQLARRNRRAVIV